MVARRLRRNYRNRSICIVVCLLVSTPAIFSREGVIQSLDKEKLPDEIDGGDEACQAFSSCAACTTSHYEPRWTAEHGVHQRPSCRWCPVTDTCFPPWDDDSQCYDFALNFTAAFKYEYDCPLGPTPYPDRIDFLPDWMGQFRASGLLANTTLMDLCLPGTHDSLSYDLSLTVSQDGLDNLERLSDILHRLSGGTVEILPGELEDFFRLQAKTQQLSVRQQLDNGIRFLDFRLMYESEADAWYSIHFMQSRETVNVYWREIRAWMDEHPEEVVIIWLSKHGNPQATGEDQYPNVTPLQKQAIWQTYASTFDGIMHDSQQTNLFRDSVELLIQRNQRIVTFAADYLEFTGSSNSAIDAASIQNRYDSGEGAFDESVTLQNHLEYFSKASTNNAAVHARGGFTLLGMNTQGDTWQIVAGAKRRFLHWYIDLFHECSSHIRMPDAPHWCPETLLDIAQLSSYYNQITFEHAFVNLNGQGATEFPNALYLDALDVDGTLRTGPYLLNGAKRGGDHATKEVKYAYVDTILAYNAKVVCRASSNATSECDQLKVLLDQRRKKYPLRLWSELSFARHKDWPTVEKATVSIAEM